MQFPTFSKAIHALMIGSGDYYRCATICLAVQRILSEDVPGCLAEVGVYRGDMSKFIHLIAPERMLYLFDTFEGFPPQDLEDQETPDERFKDTSIEQVQKNLGDMTNIIIRNGYIPDTLQGLEDRKFAFVMLDLDKYKPTLASLEFFYPRLTKGGYLIVHDFNSPESDWACNRVLSAFMKDKPERLVEIADHGGSAMFRKI